MIKEHYINAESSIEVYNSCKSYIETKACYHNVFHTINEYYDKFSNGEWKIAYGYIHAIDGLMARHCFIVDSKGLAIEPTLAQFDYFKDRLDSKQMSFVIYELDEYLDILYSNDNHPALVIPLAKYNKELEDWSKENNVFLIG